MVHIKSYFWCDLEKCVYQMNVLKKIWKHGNVRLKTINYITFSEIPWPAPLNSIGQQPVFIEKWRNLTVHWTKFKFERIFLMYLLFYFRFWTERRTYWFIVYFIFYFMNTTFWAHIEYFKVKKLWDNKFVLDGTL